jgi:sec-independent protein translocase protein TatC
MPDSGPDDPPPAGPPSDGPGEPEALPPTAWAPAAAEPAREEDAPADEAEEGVEMGFLDHLEELRITILKSGVALMLGMGVVAVFFPWIFDLLLYPFKRAEHLANPHQAEQSMQLITNGPMDVFSVLFEVTIFGGVALALPFIAYFVIQFVAPGMTSKEKGLLRPALIAALVLFATGALFSYFFIVPAGLLIALKLNSVLGLTTLWRASEYYGLVTWLTLGTGLVFEFPLILVALQLLDIISTDTLRRYRRHAIVVILIVAALVAPPEVVAMTLMALPMYILFEVSLIVGERLRRRRVAEATVS